ncbi:hypothetical protein K4K52_004757 [Colletotrichum sp. SAR 10_76]|nr:hypothetical protein K4K52_004757 [Colletotrichum sp. SAR 10_76]
MDDNERCRPAEMANDDEREAKRIRLDKAAMPTPTKRLDSKGDLYLVVGSDIRAGDPSTFLVCSKALARASPVFDKMLFGPFAESRPSTESSKQDSAWIVHLPGDEPAHFEVVLNILHCNFKKVAQRLSIPLLSGLAAFADKYDCIEIFRPWVNEWIPDLEPEGVYEEKLTLHIAWHFGCISTFEYALRAITEQSSISEDGRISIVPEALMKFNADGEEIAAMPQDLDTYLGDLIPMEIVDQIKDHRAKSVLGMMEPFVTLHDDLANGHRRCPIPGDQDECDSMLLGSLIRSFRRTTLGQPSKDAVQQYRGSVIDLEGKLGGFDLMTLRIFLSIVHGCFQDVPKELDVQDLGALLVIVDKYDALPIIRPWVKGWLETPRERWAAEGYSSHLVCYAWMTGHRAIFEKEARNAVYAEKVEPDFQFYDHEALVPPDLFEFLRKLREDILRTIMKPYLDLYRELTSGKPPAWIRDFGKCPDVHCESVMLGSLMLGFCRSGLDLTQKEFTYHNEFNGLKNLKKKLKDIKLLTYKRHDACERLLYARRLESLQYENKLVTGADIVRHEHLEHLQRQAKKTGLDEDNQASGVKH